MAIYHRIGSRAPYDVRQNYRIRQDGQMEKGSTPS